MGRNMSGKISPHGSYRSNTSQRSKSFHVRVIGMLQVIAILCGLKLSRADSADIGSQALQNDLNQGQGIGHILIVMSYPDLIFPYYVEFKTSLPPEIMKNADPGVRDIEFISLNTLYGRSKTESESVYRAIERQNSEERT